MDKKGKFEKLYKDNITSVYRFVYSRLFNKEKSEDIVSKTFLKAYEIYSQDNNLVLENPRAWLIKIAWNTLSNQFRLKKHEEIDNQDYEVVDDQIPLDQVEINDEIRNRVKKYFEKIDPETRDVIALKTWEEYQFNEIAEILNIKETTVKMKYYRGLEKLKELMDKDDLRKYAVIILSLKAITSDQAFKPSKNLINLVLDNLNLVTNTMNTDNVIETAKNTINLFGKEIATRTVATIAAATVVGVSGIGYGTYKYIDNTKKDDENVQEQQEQVEEQQNEATNIEQELTKTCKSENLRIEFLIPEDWSCEVNDYTTPEQKTDIIVKSDNISITITDGPMGEFCPEELGCKMIDFYKSDYVNVNLFIQDDVPQRLFGGIGLVQKNIPIAVSSPDNILSEEEQGLLKDIFETLKYFANEEPAEKVTPTSPELTQTCKSESLGIEFKIPQSWSCDVTDSNEPEIVTIIKSESNDLKLSITNAPRGEFCPEEFGCTMEEFFVTDYLNITIFYVDDVPERLFGAVGDEDIVTGVTKSLAVTSPDNLLSEEELTLVKKVLNTLKIAH